MRRGGAAGFVDASCGGGRQDGSRRCVGRCGVHLGGCAVRGINDRLHDMSERAGPTGLGVIWCGAAKGQVAYYPECSGDQGFACDSGAERSALGEPAPLLRRLHGASLCVVAVVSAIAVDGLCSIIGRLAPLARRNASDPFLFGLRYTTYARAAVVHAHPKVASWVAFSPPAVLCLYEWQAAP